MLGEKDEAYLCFDGSNMTKAGVVEQLIEASAVPPVLIIEEIEKCEEQHLRWLMSIMDKRGEVRRTNYRVGTQAKDVRMVILATANNVELLERYMGGAIATHFTHGQPLMAPCVILAVVWIVSVWRNTELKSRLLGQ